LWPILRVWPNRWRSINHEYEERERERVDRLIYLL
jgi:hypothetical protein